MSIRATMRQMRSRSMLQRTAKSIWSDTNGRGSDVAPLCGLPISAVLWETMMPSVFQRPALSLSEGAPNDPDLVRALQHDLRALGYLRRGIDGKFGPGTAAAVRALQTEL